MLIYLILLFKNGMKPSGVDVRVQEGPSKSLISGMKTHPKLVTIMAIYLGNNDAITYNDHAANNKT